MATRVIQFSPQKGGEKFMLQLKEWKAKKEVQLACGHKLKAGETGYTITLFVCQQEASCLPQAIKACFAAQTKQATAEQPDILYKLWHACFGKKQHKRPA
jgi:hypothetical protein